MRAGRRCVRISPRVTVSLECEAQDITPLNGWPDLSVRAKAARVKERVNGDGASFLFVHVSLGALSPILSQPEIVERRSSVN